MRRVRPTVFVTQGEDVTNQAGWMYADLFLALMVIFLATISFVPQLTQLPGNSLGAKSVAIQLKDLNYSAGLVTDYKLFDIKAISKDVANFRIRQGIPTSADIIYTQIVGGYDPKKESANVGTVNAIGFSVKLKDLGQEIFGRSSISITTSDQIPSGSVALRMTFASNGNIATK
jgi:hypothetical protein